MISFPVPYCYGSFLVLIILGIMSLNHSHAFVVHRYNRLSCQINSLQNEEVIKRPVYPELKNGMTFFYLKKILLIDDKSLILLIIKYPWLLYLNVETNLMPTVSVLKSFGFKESDVKRLVAQIPSILAINHEWTLPEKLLSIQKMFYLSRASQLVKVILQQPLLLTSSIDRNFAVASYLTNEIGLTPDELHKLILIYPRVTMIGLPILTASWSVLTDIYGFSENEAKALIIKYPKLLSNEMLKSGSRRMQFIRRELGVQPPFDEARKVIHRFPPLLYLDLDYFLITNVKVLKYILKLNSNEAIALMSVFPQLLGYNPASLDQKCCTILYFLTGLPEYSHPTARIYSHHHHHYSHTTRIDKDEIAVDSSESSNIRGSSEVVEGVAGEMRKLEVGGMLQLGDRDIAGEEEEGEVEETQPLDTNNLIEDPASLDLLQEFFQLPVEQIPLPEKSISLCLPFEKAVHIIQQTPWLLAYRLDRSLSVLLSLKYSLEMSDIELTRCLTIYPRLTSLSITGKLKDLLVELATLAMPYIAEEEEQLDDVDDVRTAYNNSSTISASQKQIRAMIREVILKYPLLLGCSLDRLRRRSNELSYWSLPFIEIINLIRRTDEGHERWLEKEKKKNNEKQKKTKKKGTLNEMNIK